MLVYHGRQINNNKLENVQLEPTLTEIANEWNCNVYTRAQELETKIDKTYLTVIVPFVLDTLHKLVSIEAKTLDVGCGLGHITGLISRNGYDVTGIDVAEKAIEYAKKTFTDTKYCCASIIGFSEENEENFDACVVNMVLHNLVDIKNNLLALNRILKAGGYVIASIPDPQYWFNKHHNLNTEFYFDYNTSSVYKIPFKIRRGSIHPSPITYIHRPIYQYNQLIKDAGFTVKTSQHPTLSNGKLDTDILFCIWRKQ